MDKYMSDFVHIARGAGIWHGHLGKAYAWPVEMDVTTRSGRFVSARGERRADDCLLGYVQRHGLSSRLENYVVE